MAYLSLHSGARSYELVGDSMLKRLYRFYNQDTHNGNIGLCIGGQTMSQLCERLNGRSVNQNVIVQIGTNDLLAKYDELDIDRMKNNMLEVISALQDSGASKIVVLTLPPIPQFGYRNGVLKVWKKFNKFILADLPSQVSNVSVVNTGKLFYNFATNKFKKELFIDDGVHWNATGIQHVLDMLEDEDSV